MDPRLIDLYNDYTAMPLAPTLPWWGEVIDFMEGREAAAAATPLPP